MSFLNPTQPLPTPEIETEFFEMAAMSSSPLTMLSAETLKQPTLVGSPLAGSRAQLWKRTETKKKRASTVVAVAGDVAADSTPYLIGGAALVALVGTAFPILFSRKDM